MHEALDQLPVPSGIKQREHCDREQLQSMAYRHAKILLSFNCMCKLCRKMPSCGIGFNRVITAGDGTFEAGFNGATAMGTAVLLQSVPPVLTEEQQQP